MSILSCPECGAPVSPTTKFDLSTKDIICKNCHIHLEYHPAYHLTGGVLGYFTLRYLMDGLGIGVFPSFGILSIVALIYYAFMVPIRVKKNKKPPK